MSPCHHPSWCVMTEVSVTYATKRRTECVDDPELPEQVNKTVLTCATQGEVGHAGC